MGILGERWTVLILRESFYGVRRFSEMQRNLGIARNILSARLQTLVAAGVLERRRSEGSERHEYRLTDMGRDLYPVLVAIMRWGDKHLAGDDGPPVVLRHTCGHDAEPEIVCRHCHEPLRARDVTPEGRAGGLGRTMTTTTEAA